METILILYGLYVMNKGLPTRVDGTSKTLTAYIVPDQLNAETFETQVSDTPFGTSEHKPIVHRATSNISEFQINTKNQSRICGKGVGLGSFLLTRHNPSHNNLLELHT